MGKINSLKIIFFAILFLLIFWNWFISDNIIGGDWPYFFDETIQALSLFPPGWSAVHGNGLGGIIPGYFLDQYLYFTAFLSSHVLQIPWEVGYKVFWFGAFLALSVFSSMYLVKTVFVQVKLWQMALAAIIFTANTYVLMVVGGGQMGVALSYAIAPLVLARFLMIIQSLKFKVQSSFVAGLVLGAHIMFDPRITFITMIAIVIYAISTRSIKKNILNTFVIPVGIAVLLNSYWIFPLLFTRTLPIPEGFVSVSGFEFFSFADFSHSFSLLHPNWPENVFGKVYFMRPEFLVLPILAYSSLLFLSSKFKVQSSKLQLKIKSFENNLAIEQFSNRTILFFALLGLLGAFLAKGANPPFGEINIWMFEYIPGFSMFRDPTKFYVLAALSYSVLIPFSIYSIYIWLSAKCKVQSAKLQFKVKSYLPKLFLISTILYLLFLIRPVFLRELGGTFRKHEIPKEYVLLKDFLYKQPDFFRTLWVPRQQRFTFVSNIHPAIEAMPLFEATNSSQIISRLQRIESKRFLEELSVKYIVIPYDSLGEIFLQDRKYDEKQRIDLEKQLDNIGWLKKIKTGKITIYETNSLRDHFWLDKGEISYRMVSPTQYLAEISISTSDSLTFSENYSQYWMVKVEKDIIKSKKTKDGFNNFPLRKTGIFTITVFYAQDQYYWYGRIISIGVFLLLVLFLIKPWIQKNIIKRFKIPIFF